MIYDRRQGPPAFYDQGRIFIAYQAEAFQSADGGMWAYPLITAFDLESKSFEPPVVFGPPSDNHHHGPVLWPDDNGRIQVLVGCHKTPGLHLVSRRPGDIGSSIEDWTYGRWVAPSLSYPSLFRLPGNRALVYYRTHGHPSSWTYRITRNNGITWAAPETDVTNLDAAGALDWSSYHSVQPSPDGRFLHVAFSAYDDNKARDRERFYNPRYRRYFLNGGEKYNLYTLRIDLESGTVTNGADQPLATPVHRDQADRLCRVWDTDWRYTNIPPAIAFDARGQPVFLHVLSDDDSFDAFTYYFVAQRDGQWSQTAIAPSNHSWNGAHLESRPDGSWRALLVGGGPELDPDQRMDKHGGGRVEEWISRDDGHTWERLRDLTPDSGQFPDWRFNNIRPVTHPGGSPLPGWYVCYGWPPGGAPNGRAFLLHLPI